MKKKNHFFFAALLPLAAALWSFDQAQAQLKTPQQAERELPVHYVFLGDGKYSPAFVDNKSKTAYVWEEVTLTHDQVPGLKN